MAIFFSPAQLERFRREAKKLGRETSVSHNEALDRIAAEHGFKNWSLLAKHSESVPTASSRRTESPVQASDPRRRYYLHGDVVEDDPTRCYCARCDLFVEFTHFATTKWHQDGSDGERYLNSLARWQRLPRSQKADRRRPTKAANVLAAAALAAREAYEVSRGAFHRWLEAQRGRNDPVRNLADDVFSDKEFPVSAVTYRELEDYLSWHGDHVVLALEQAWREFSALRTLT